MANSAQSKKRARQNETRRAHTMGLRSTMRTAVKKVLHAINGGDKDAATQAYRTAVPFLDSLVNKKIIHANRAARYKSRLNAKIKALS